MSRSRRRSTWWRASLAGSILLGLGIGAGGCVAPGPEVAVAEGRAFSTGDPAYDEFFSTLHGLQVELEHAPLRQRSIRRQLARATGASETATADELAAVIAKRAAALRKSGVRLVLTVDEGAYDAGAYAELRTVGSVPDAQRALLDGIRQSAHAEVQLLVSMRLACRQLEQLRWLAEALDRNLERALSSHGAAQRATIRNNLRDAQVLILFMLARASAVGDAAREMLGKLEHAMRAAGPGPGNPVDAAALRSGGRRTDRPAAGPDRGGSSSSGSETAAPPTDFDP